MSENVQMTLIVVGGLVVLLVFALWMFKNRLDSFSFTANKKSLTAKMEQRQNTGIAISGNIQDGNNNEIAAETVNSTIENNLQKGDDNRIRATATSKKS
jgi:FtsZ-interacting cell division protein ZipA